MLTDAQTERHLAQTGWQVIAGDKQGRTWHNPAYESTLQRLHADLGDELQSEPRVG